MPNDSPPVFGEQNTSTECRTRTFSVSVTSPRKTARSRSAELSVAALAAVAEYDWAVVAREVVSVYETVVLGRATVGVAQ